jgi:hypothetical protein
VSSGGVELWPIVEEDVLLVAVYGREWAFGKFHLRGSAPEIQSILTRIVHEFEGVLKAVKVELMGT